MARITVEDCLLKVDNRFDLILIAVDRARSLAMGAESFVKSKNDKYPVIALREIAEGFVTAKSNVKKNLNEIIKSVFHDT